MAITQTVLPGFPEQESSALTPRNDLLAIIDRASASGVDIATLKELWAMKLEHDRIEAKRAFDEAMQVFKQHLPTIRKTKGVTIEKGANAKPAYYYAPLEEVCDKLIPALNAVGITHAWKMAYEGEWMVVTCVLSGHGHNEGTSMRGCADKTGAKNSIQAEGSTLSYLERYTLCAACGIAIKNADNDAAGTTAVDPRWLAEQLEDMGRCETKEGLRQAYQAAVAIALDKHKDINAYEQLKAANATRKGQL